MIKSVQMSQAQLRALLTDAFSKGRDYQRTVAEHGAAKATELEANAWGDHLKKLCGDNY